MQYTVFSRKTGGVQYPSVDRFAIEREESGANSLYRERERVETKETFHYEGDARERGRRRGEKKRAKEES